MTDSAGGGRSRRRVALEVVVLGALVLLAVFWAQRGGDEVGAAASQDDPIETPAPEATTEPTRGSVTIPSDPEVWRAMSTSDVEEVGRAVAERTPGFGFDRVQVFTGAGLSNAIAVLVHEKTGLEFSLIPPGSFEMGTSETEAGRFHDQGPVHRVTFARPFLLSRTECTRAAWALGRGAAAASEADGDLPRADVDWNDVTSWCSDLGLRLPSEAEWEYACRAGTTTRFWSGDDEADLARVGWYNRNSDGEVHPVGAKPPNPLGLYDIHGNAWEWCEDTWRDSHDGAPNDGSAWVDQASEGRVLRGGSFDDPARYARSAFRFWVHPGDRWYFLGFRPARSVTAE